MKNYLLLTIAALVSALAFTLFLAPTNMAPGGLAGLGIILNELTGLSEGTSMIVASIPILILGYFNLGRVNFLKRALFLSLTYSLSIELLNRVLPPTGITDDLLLNALFGGMVGGIGTGLIHRARSTFPGTSIISRIIQLRTGMPVSQIYILVDGVLILILGLLFGWDKALYAVLMLFIWGVAADYVLEGPSVIRTVLIITAFPQEVSQELLTRLGIGVTSWSGEGQFTKEPRQILFCTVSRSDVPVLEDMVKAIDKNVFLVIGHGHQATGGVVRPIGKKKALLEDLKAEDAGVELGPPPLE